MRRCCRAQQLDLHRYADLAKKSFAPVQQVDDQQATVNKDTAAVALDNAMIETAQINLGYCVIRAPIDGRLSFYQINVGNVIQATGQTGIISITQDKPISVVLTLPEADLLAGPGGACERSGAGHRVSIASTTTNRWRRERC